MVYQRLGVRCEAAHCAANVLVDLCNLLDALGLLRALHGATGLGEAERALQRKADGAITSDWEAAAASVNLGGAISRHRPRSKIVRDVQALLDRMVPLEADAAKPRRRFGR